MSAPDNGNTYTTIELAGYSGNVIKAIRQLNARVNDGRRSGIHFRFEEKKTQDEGETEPTLKPFAHLPQKFEPIVKQALAALTAADATGTLIIPNGEVGKTKVDEKLIEPFIATIRARVDAEIQATFAARARKAEQSGEDFLHRDVKRALDRVVGAMNEGKPKEERVSFRLENGHMVFEGPAAAAKKTRGFYDELTAEHDKGVELTNTYVTDYIFRHIISHEDEKSQFIKTHRSDSRRRTVKLGDDITPEMAAILRSASGYYQNKKSKAQHTLNIGVYADEIIVFSNNTETLQATNKALREIIKRMKAETDPAKLTARDGYKTNVFEQIWREALGEARTEEAAKVAASKPAPAPAAPAKPELMVIHDKPVMLESVDGYDLRPFIAHLSARSKSIAALKGFEKIDVKCRLTEEEEAFRLEVSFPHYYNPDGSQPEELLALAETHRLAFERSIRAIAEGWLKSNGTQRLRDDYIAASATTYKRMIEGDGRPRKETGRQVVEIKTSIHVRTLRSVDVNAWVAQVLDPHKNRSVTFQAFSEFDRLDVNVTPTMDASGAYFAITPRGDDTDISSEVIGNVERILRRLYREWDFDKPPSKTKLKEIIGDEFKKIDREIENESVLAVEEQGGSILAKDFRSRGNHPKNEIHIPGRKDPIIPSGMSPEGIAEQDEFIRALNDDDTQYLFALGPAGVGKTYLAIARAVEALERGEVDRIILAKPNVEMGDPMGFLPGEAKDKVGPHVESMMQYLRKFYSEERIANLTKLKKIQIEPIAFMRGRNFDNAFIVIDEGQNVIDQVLESIITRKARSSKLVVVGDGKQSDRAIDLGKIMRTKLDDILGNSRRIKALTEFKAAATGKKDKALYDYDRQIAFLKGQIERTKDVTSRLAEIIETNGQYETPIEMVSRALTGMRGFKVVKLSAESTVRDERIPEITSRLARARAGHHYT